LVTAVGKYPRPSKILQLIFVIDSSSSTFDYDRFVHVENGRPFCN
jgi:hypothetical protein